VCVCACDIPCPADDLVVVVFVCVCVCLTNFLLGIGAYSVELDEFFVLVVLQVCNGVLFLEHVDHFLPEQLVIQ